jgi:hypothetical protein
MRTHAHTCAIHNAFHRFPRTIAGQIVIVIAILFGMMYLTMPLTIIQWQFQRQNLLWAKHQRKQQEKLSVLENAKSNKLSIMIIIKVKRWAKRARGRLRGHHVKHDDESSAVKMIGSFVHAVYDLAEAHDYPDVMRFRKVHENLVANVIAKMSRDMRASDMLASPWASGGAHFHRGGLGL